MDFLETFLLGPDMLGTIAPAISSQLNVESALLACNGTVGQGIVIFGVCLFRATSGGLLTWAIKVI
jgi:hypothetical protein